MTPTGRLVLVESPFKGRNSANHFERHHDAMLNSKYARALCLYVARGGNNPFASHVFCTQFLNDDIPEERARGIEIGLSWGVHAEMTVVGVDRGISEGMRLGIENARQAHRPIVWVSLAEFAPSWLPPFVQRDAWKALHDNKELIETYNGEI